MKVLSTASVLLLLVVFLFSCKRENKNTYPPQPVTAGKSKIFILTETKGYRHESIEAGLAMFNKRADDWRVEISHAEESAVMKEQDIKEYDIIVLLNSTGNIFTEEEQALLEEYLAAGGAILGIHAAADAEYDWPWYGQMLGGWFRSHPEIQEAKCLVADGNHPVATGLPAVWERTDEWYNFKHLSHDNKVILLLDESTYSGGIHGDYHPISWCREWGGGRIFYTGMGHTAETYSEPLFQTHIQNAIQWLHEQAIP